jgi:transposase
MSQARQRWTERLDRYRQSGLTVTDFCAEEGVSVPSFYLWKRKLASPTPL